VRFAVGLLCFANFEKNVKYDRFLGKLAMVWYGCRIAPRIDHLVNSREKMNLSHLFP
jgi:hypothetical protein